jgi:hypothetical protein
MAFAGVAVVRTMDNLKRCADMFHSIAHTVLLLTISQQFKVSIGRIQSGEIGEDALAAHAVNRGDGSANGVPLLSHHLGMSTAVQQPNICIPATTAGMDRSGDVSGGSKWDVAMRELESWKFVAFQGGNLTNVIHPCVQGSFTLAMYITDITGQQ